jgi:hypothetical protein
VGFAGFAGIVGGIVLMFITGMVRDGVLLVAATLACLVFALGWALVLDDPGPWWRKLGMPAAFLLSGLALGIGFCGIVGLFAAHTDAYVWARGQDVQLQVPTVENGGSTCRQVGSEVGGGTWDCDLSWTVSDDNQVDGIADVSSAELDNHGDTIPARALGSDAVSAGLGRSLPDSQVVLGDIPWWVGPAGVGLALLLGLGGVLLPAIVNEAKAS